MQTEENGMKKIMIIAMTTGLLVGGMTPLLAVNPVNASQKPATTNTLKKFPKNFRRTWYHYDGHGRYEQMTFKANKYNGKFYYHGWNKWARSLHYWNLNPLFPNTNYQPTWSYGTYDTKAAGLKWMRLYGWNQTTGAGEYYSLMTKHSHGKKFKVLNYASGSGIWINQHYYPSKKIAKQMKNKHFAGLNY